MRQELNDFELNEVTGGRYYVNGNTKKVAWDNIPGAYKLINCSVYQAMEAMDGLRGTCKTQAEYDKACFDLLNKKGWLEIPE